MIYALVREQVPEDDRQVLLDAIEGWNSSVLKRYANQDDIRHIMDATDSEEYYCIWCDRRVKPVGRTTPASRLNRGTSTT